MAQREEHQRRTLVSFRKTYGTRIYSFHYEKTEVEGYTSVLITVRRKNEGDSKLRVGELVHMIMLQDIDDEEDAAERIEQVLLTGDVTTAQDLNYFPTPTWLAGKMARLAHVGVGDRVLEPSAGRGAIVNVLADLGADVEAIEQHEPFAKELANAGRCRVQHVGDFLQLGALASKPIDAVVMNPPFVRQADLHHVRHALRFLRSGGTLVSVMSNGVMFRDNRMTTEFRDMVTERGGYFESLPEDSFKESGTGVRTVLVVIPG